MDSSSSGVRAKLFDDERASHHFAPDDLAFHSDSGHLSEFLELEQLAGMESGSLAPPEDEMRIKPLPESDLTLGIDASLLESSSGSDTEPQLLDEGEGVAETTRKRRTVTIIDSADSYQTQSDDDGEVREKVVQPVDIWSHRHRGDSDSDSVSEFFKRNP
jgi:hypothetical protein